MDLVKRLRQESGYYLAVQCNNGTYAPLYNLNADNDTIAAVATYVDGLAAGNNVKVTVTGTNHHGDIEAVAALGHTGERERERARQNLSECQMNMSVTQR